MKEDDIRNLLNSPSETKNLDFKESFKWEEAPEKYKLIKHILGMANTENGGTIIIGVKDNRGKFEFIGMNQDHCDSFKKEELNDLLESYSDCRLACDLQKTQFDGKWLVIINVPESVGHTVYCIRNYPGHSKENKILEEGVVYYRTDTPSTRKAITFEEIKSINERNLAKLAIYSKNESDNDKSYRNEFSAALNYIRNKNNTVWDEIDKYGKWHFSIIPIGYNESFIKDFNDVETFLNAFRTKFYKWPCPYIDDIVPLSNAFYSSTENEFFLEAFYAFESGQFHWKRTFIEEYHNREEPTSKNNFYSSSPVYAVYAILSFLVQYCKKYFGEHRFNMKFTVSNLGGRRLLLDGGSNRIHFREHVCTINNISIPDMDNLSAVILEKDFDRIALDIIRYIHRKFNFVEQAEYIEKFKKDLMG